MAQICRPRFFGRLTMSSFAMFAVLAPIGGCRFQKGGRFVPTGGRNCGHVGSTLPRQDPTSGRRLALLKP